MTLGYILVSWVKLFLSADTFQDFSLFYFANRNWSYLQNCRAPSPAFSITSIVSEFSGRQRYEDISRPSSRLAIYDKDDKVYSKPPHNSHDRRNQYNSSRESTPGLGPSRGGPANSRFPRYTLQLIERCINHGPKNNDKVYNSETGGLCTNQQQLQDDRFSDLSKSPTPSRDCIHSKENVQYPGDSIPRRRKSRKNRKRRSQSRDHSFDSMSKDTNGSCSTLNSLSGHSTPVPDEGNCYTFYNSNVVRQDGMARVTSLERNYNCDWRQHPQSPHKSTSYPNSPSKNYVQRNNDINYLSSPTEATNFYEGPRNAALVRRNSADKPPTGRADWRSSHSLSSAPTSPTSESLPSQTLPSLALPSQALPSQALPSPTLPSPTLPSPTLTSPTLTSPTLTSPTLTSPTLTSPTLTSPALTSPALTSPALTSPALTSPALPSPALPSLTLPSLAPPTPTLSSHIQTLPSQTPPIETLPSRTPPAATVECEPHFSAALPHSAVESNAYSDYISTGIERCVAEPIKRSSHIEFDANNQNKQVSQKPNCNTDLYVPRSTTSSDASSFSPECESTPEELVRSPACDSDFLTLDWAADVEEEEQRQQRLLEAAQSEKNLYSDGHSNASSHYIDKKTKNEIIESVGQQPTIYRPQQDYVSSEIILLVYHI